MTDFEGFYTTDGRRIYSNEFIENLRRQEDEKKVSNVFIAQSGPQEKDLHTNVDILVTGGNRGGGKANPYTTPVRTPTGIKKMGDIKVGDVICTPYEGHQKVTQIFEQGVNTVYRFYFDDGTWVDCMDNHRFVARFGKDESYREMTARDIMDRYKIGVRNPGSLRRGLCDLTEFPICGEVELNEDIDELALPIHPFVLGYASGSGYWEFSKYGLKVKKDTFVIGKIYCMGLLPKKIYGEYYIRGFTNEDRRKITRARVPELAYIPEMYMTASISARYQYLRGLISTGGGLYKKHPYLAAPNKKLMEQVAELARSLGMWATTHEVIDDPKRVGYWMTQIVAPNDADVFAKTNYKVRSRINTEKATSYKKKNILSKKLLWINKLDTRQNCRCITVSGNDHLYLTDQYTINHNTFTLLMEAMKDFDNPDFSGIIFRKELNDLRNIVKDSKTLYSHLGRYNRSKDDMTWNLKKGGTLKFNYFNDNVDEFKDRFQGHQYSYIGFDEFTQVSYEKFKYMITCNRNAAGIRNRVIGTCNPDPMSWVAKFIEWWIDEKGDPIPERDGVVRYCCMKGDTVESIVWGDSPHSVYLQCKDFIDRMWTPELEEMGYDKERMFTKSVTFIRAELMYNKKLLKADPKYYGSLANQSDEQIARDLGGNWKFMSAGNDMVKMIHLVKCFSNPQMTGDGIKRASCDVAFTGGDSCVIWLWIGWHVHDIAVFKLDSMATCYAVKAKLDEWGVTEENFTYDLNGLGQTFRGFFKHAVPFNNLEAVSQQYKNVYDNLKSQCAYTLAKKLQDAEISFNPNILELRFSGKGFEDKPLKDILQEERKCIRKDETKTDKGWCLIKKEQMKKIVGHSPDFFEALIMRMIFELTRKKVEIPDWVDKF